MLKLLAEKYQYSGYDGRIKVNSRGEPCDNHKLHPDCKGYCPHIIISAQDKNAELSMTIIADCDECRRVSTNQYVKLSTDLEAVFRIKVPGIGEIRRREREGDYYHFEELECIVCDKCNVTYSMERTDYDRDLDGDDENSMKRRSGKKANEIEAKMMAEDNPCRDNHHLLMKTLSRPLAKFTKAMNRVTIPGKSIFGSWSPYNCVEAYLEWRFPLGKYNCGREQLILILLAHDYDTDCVLSHLPMEILIMILTKK